MVGTTEQTKGIQDLFQERLDDLKRKDYRKYRNLCSELFEWGAAISLRINGNGNLGYLIERQIKFIAKDVKTNPEELMNRMFNDYIKGDDCAFATLFHHLSYSDDAYALKRG